MSEGTSASTYVLCPFQALVPGFGIEVGGQKIRGKVGVVLGVELRGQESRGELIQYSN